MSDSPLNEITEHSIVVSADATIPSRASARMAHAGSGHAGTVDHDHTRPTTHTGLRDNAVWLRHWRGRHCLCGGSERQPEQSKHHRFDHCFLPAFHNSFCVVSEECQWHASLKIVSSVPAQQHSDDDQRGPTAKHLLVQMNPQ
jgi:hypothetical protein